MLESLKGILARDGLGKVQVLGGLRVVGRGVDKVRAAIRQVVGSARPVAAAGCRYHQGTAELGGCVGRGGRGRPA